MLNNKKVNIVLAFIVAVVLWAYVLGEVNPESNIVVRNVPINFVNQEALDEKGLTILDTSEDSINISIVGKRTAVTKVKKSDFSVTADVEAMEEGENVARLKVTGPDGVKIEDTNVEKVTVTVDRRVTENKEIKVVIKSAAGNNKEASVIETDQKSISVTGPKTLVDMVDRVEATLSISDISDTIKTISAPLLPVDRSGNLVEGVTLSDNNLGVTVVLVGKKTVNLEVPLENENEGGIERTVQHPETVVIKGSEADLENITVITCKALNLAGIDEDTELKLEPVLPAGIEISDESEALRAKVTVKAPVKKSFTINAKDISILNKQEGKSYIINTDTLTIEALGSDNAMNALKDSDIRVSIDVADLESGNHSVPLNIKCSKTGVNITSSSKEVDVTVE